MNFRGSSIKGLFVNFKNAFTQPSFENFVALAQGWVLCQGRHSISRVIQFIPDREGSSHSRFYNFFSHARWRADDLSMHLVPMTGSLTEPLSQLFRNSPRAARQ